MRSNQLIRIVALTLIVGTGAVTQGFATADSSDQRKSVFATVNGEAILQASYLTALQVAGRQRFYHGKAPEAELESFRKDVAERLIVERVMLQEAVRRGLEPDHAWVEQEFSKIEQRYSVSPEWNESADLLKKQIRDGLKERNLIAQVDAASREVAQPTEAEVRAYYQANPDKFTSPEQIRVSTILLKVEPWQSSEVWAAQAERAQKILVELRQGADFDAYSVEFPPEDNAQLGYLHRGMLGETAQSAIDQLEPGQITDVITLLEGVAIFRLDERLHARLNPLSVVYERAAKLFAREQSEAAYERRMNALRARADVVFTNPDYFRVAPVVTLQDADHRRPSGAQTE